MTTSPKAKKTQVATAMKCSSSPLLITSLALFGAATAAQAGPVAKPEKLVTCAACHGENGVSATPTYPTLAGQYSNYIEHALHAYQTGERKNAIMGAQAANLSQADIKQLAAWFSQQPGPLFTLAVPGNTAK